LAGCCFSRSAAAGIAERITARELVNTVSYEELKRILYEYGEERYAPAIAKKI